MSASLISCFERLVPFFEFRKMRFNRHVACLLAVRSAA